MMFQEDMIGTPSDDLCIDGISSPIAAHLLDFCDDGSGGNLFTAVTTTSDLFAASSEDVSSSSTTTPPLCSYRDDTPAAAAATAFSPLPSFDSTLSALLEQEQPPDPEPELLPAIDYTFSAPAPYAAAAEETQPEQFGQMTLPEAIADPVLPLQMSSGPPALMPLTSGYTDECFTAAIAGGYMGLDGTLYQPGAMLPCGGGEAAQGGFFSNSSTSNNGLVMMGMEEIGEYQRLMEGGGALVGTFGGADSMQRVFNNTAEMQVGGTSQNLISGCSGSPPPLPSTEISGLEDSTFKVGRLSVEERREKIHRYMKKRNERNFSKKIKYACRKTLADSRPRVRGRFAKNDEYCEATRPNSQNQEYYNDRAGVKEEDILDSSDILAHISGVNSFKYNYTVESWI